MIKWTFLSISVGICSTFLYVFLKYSKQSSWKSNSDKSVKSYVSNCSGSLTLSRTIPRGRIILFRSDFLIAGYFSFFLVFW